MMRMSIVLAIAVFAASGCTPVYTPLSYNTADIEPTVTCAKYVLPADVEFLRKAGGWQIGRLETARVSAKASSSVAANGGTHFYTDERTLMAVHVPDEKLAQLPGPLQPNRGSFPHGCTQDSFR